MLYWISVRMILRKMLVRLLVAAGGGSTTMTTRSTGGRGEARSPHRPAPWTKEGRPGEAAEAGPRKEGSQQRRMRLLRETGGVAGPTRKGAGGQNRENRGGSRRMHGGRK